MLKIRFCCWTLLCLLGIVLPANATPPTEQEFVANYLLAEIAGQRGDFLTASQLMYALAEGTSNIALAERAARVAAFAHITPVTLAATRLWLTLDPQSIEAQQAATETFLKENQFTEAFPFLEKILEEENSRGQFFLYIASVIAQTRSKTLGLQLIQKLAIPYPALPEAALAEAQVAALGPHSDVALKALDRALALQPGWDAAALLKAQLLESESPAVALAFYKDFLDHYPETVDLRLHYAALLTQQRQYPLAKLEFPAILEATINNPNVTILVGLLAVQGEDYTFAEQQFQEALDLGVQDRDQVYLYLAQSAEKRHDLKVAKDWYSRLNRGPRFLEAQIYLANITAREQSVDKAIESLKALDNLNPSEQQIVMQAQARLLTRAKRYQEAFDLLELALSNLPNTPDLLYEYALAAERIQSFDESEKALRQTIAARPDFAPAYNALGYALADRNIRLEEAQHLIEKSLQLSPGDSYILDSLGWVHYRRGRLKEALHYLSEAYRLSQDIEIAAHLGEVLWKNGQLEEARQVWEKARLLDTENDVLNNTLQRFGL